MMTTLHKVQAPRPGTYRLDPTASEITFDTKHLFGLGKVTGTFGIESATIEVASPPEKSSVRASVDARSFASGSATRDKQVRSKKFLNAEEFPAITFASTELHRVDGDWVLEGELTARGRSQPVSLQVTESVPGEDSVALVATTRVDRYAHGITASRGMAARHLDITLRVTARAEH
jgi:polyisoprenoid-binding protein YceI